MGSHSITSISYHLTNELNNNKRCVEVNFLFGGKTTQKLVYFKQESGCDYVKSAKRIIEEELKNGKLEKYAKKYHKKTIIVPKLAVAASVVAIGAIAVGAFFTWRSLTPAPLINPRKGDVVDAKIEAVDKDGGKHRVSVSNTVAIVGDPYKTDIILEEVNATMLALPETLNKVTSNGKEVSEENYTYELVSEKKAQLMIPGDNVEGNVDISLTLRDLDITVTMKVGNINGCSVSYKGNPLVEGQTYIDFPTELVEFRISNVDFGYIITKDSFDIKYEGGKITPTYDETTHTVSFIALHNFTFNVSKILPENAVIAHVTYPTDSVDISYGTSHKIENDELLPVVPRTSTHKEIGDFYITLNKDIVTSLIPLEITCSLPGSKVELIAPLGKDVDYSLVLNLEDCTEIIDFTLDIHPGTYSPIDVSVTKGQYCAAISHDGVELSYEEPNAITPIKDDNGMAVTFEVATTGSILKETDIVCSLGYVPTISLIVNNVFQVKFTESSFDSFVLGVNPREPAKSAEIRINTNKRCTVTYRNLPVPQGWFTVVPIPINEDEYLFFDVYLKEDVEFKDDHVWIEDDNPTKKSFFRTSVTQDESYPSHYTVAVWMIDHRHFADVIMFDYLEIMPGPPVLTVDYDRTECPNVYYINEKHEEQLVEPNTPYDYMPIITPEGNKTVQFHVEVAEGCYANRVRSPDGRWEQSGDLILKPGATRTLVATCEEMGSEIYVPANISVTSFRFSTIPEARIEFNGTVKSVTFGDTTITTPGKIEHIDPVAPNADFIVETDGVMLTEDNVICEPLDPRLDPEITVQPMTGTSYIYKVSIMPSSHRISYWEMFYFTLKINPEEDIQLNTIKGGDTDTYTLKYKDGEAETEISTSGTPLIYQKGTYEYEFIATPDETHRINTDGYEAIITKKDQTGTLNLAVEATDTGVIVKFETFEARSILNHGNISSIEIVVRTDALTDATATFTFDSAQYLVYDSAGDQIDSGEEVHITNLEVTFYIKTKEDMNSEYVILSEGATGVSHSVSKYQGAGDYDYVLTLSNITSAVSAFDVSIALPAMLMLDDSTQGVFVDESTTPPQMLENRISINYYIGQTTVDFYFYADQGTTNDYRVTFISSTDPDITGFAETPELGTLVWGQYFKFTIKFSKPITRSTVITIHVEINQ